MTEALARVSRIGPESRLFGEGAAAMVQFAAGASPSSKTLLADIGYGTQHRRYSDDPQRITIGTPVIGNGVKRELWRLPGVHEAGWVDEIGYALGEEFLFAHLLVTESSDTDIRRLTHRAYSRLLAFVGQTDCPHLLRVWNYLPQINALERDMERYQAFCQGRAMAFADCAIPERSFPAATAIGCDTAGLSVHLLAARRKGTPIENPRQLSAYHYPFSYGPRPPSFARAMCYTGPQQTWQLAISGTASIVGHITMHPGDLERQLLETIRNLESVIDNTRIASQTRERRLPGLLKVYLRDPSSVRDVDAILRAWTAGHSHIMYLHGAICRNALNLEIEGHDAIVARDRPHTRNAAHARQSE